MFLCCRLSTACIFLDSLLASFEFNAVFFLVFSYRLARRGDHSLVPERWAVGEEPHFFVLRLLGRNGSHPQAHNLMQ